MGKRSKFGCTGSITEASLLSIPLPGSGVHRQTQTCILFSAGLRNIVQASLEDEGALAISPLDALDYF